MINFRKGIKMNARFIGRDGSRGLRLGKEYLIRIKWDENSNQVWVTIGKWFPKWVPYTNYSKLLENWEMVD